MKERIVCAAGGLLAEGGREAVTTRAVASAAGVQVPTIYRLFGDMRGLLDAVAAHGFDSYLSKNSSLEPTEDPVGDLRSGWDLHIRFGLANPALYSLVYGEPSPGELPPPASAAYEVLAEHIRWVAEAGRLSVDQERAARLVHATGRGTTLTLISMPEDHRDMTLSRMAREAVIAAITTDAPAAPPPEPETAAVTLRALLPRTTALTDHECGLMGEWLDRIANPDGRSKPPGSTQK